VTITKKGYQRMTAEEEARQIENQERFRDVLRKALERQGASPEEIERRVGPPRSTGR
jgi:predicted transcriptional regulator